MIRSIPRLQNGYLDQVDHWSIDDASENPPRLVETGPSKLDSIMDGAEPYRTSNHHPKSIEEDRSARIAGALAALKRGAAKAVARDLAAGLEPIVRKPKPKAEEPTDSV